MIPPRGVVNARPSGESSTLCVDLDGTLILSDTLFESLACLLRTRPLHAFLIPFWLLRGRAYLKHQLAVHGSPDVTLLPYNQELISYLRQARAEGRQIVLATGSDELIARKIAQHLGCFSEVFASGGGRNLVGSAKLEALCERFGRNGFAYIGDSTRDLPVWKSAAEAMVAGAGGRAVRLLSSHGIQAVTIGATPEIRLRHLVRGLRVHQWVKNLLVFVPLITSHHLMSPPLMLKALAAAASLSLCASGVYLLNDIVDIESDRRHRSKRSRPIAAGQLPIQTALAVMPLLWLAAFSMALYFAPAVLGVLLLYLAIACIYSFHIKTVPILDVMVLGGLYTLRIWAGGAATAIVISPWLLGFSIFTFVSLALVKRYSELNAAGADPRRGFLHGDASLILSMGIASGYTAALVLALYISSPDVHVLYPAPAQLWWLCPMYLYWMSRIWLLAHHGAIHDDPIVFAVRDRATWILAGVSIIPLALASGVVQKLVR